MSDEIKTMLVDGLEGLGNQLKSAMDQYNTELEKSSQVSTELTGKIDDLAIKYSEMRDELMDVSQKQLIASAEPAIKTAGIEFINSDQFKALAKGTAERVRFEVKNTVVANNTTVLPTQRQGVIPGDFLPVTIRSRIPTINVANNAVNALREATNVNRAAETTQGSAKPESDVTFEQYNVAIETVAHWIKVSTQLLADAPAIAAYIDTRLRDGLAQRIDRQLLLGNGIAPNLSGLTNAGNFVAYTPTSGDNLVNAINRAKYALWATGNMPDTVIVNPADWSETEIEREANGGAYLYGAPGTVAGASPFGVQVVMSNHMPQGEFLIGNLGGATTVFQRQGAVVEMGYINDDFTRNLVTIRAEERLGLAVDRPSAILYGDIADSASS